MLTMFNRNHPLSQLFETLKIGDAHQNGLHAYWRVSQDTIYCRKKLPSKFEYSELSRTTRYPVGSFISEAIDSYKTTPLSPQKITEFNEIIDLHLKQSTRKSHSRL